MSMRYGEGKDVYTRWGRVRSLWEMEEVKDVYGRWRRVRMSMGDGGG